MAYRCQSCFERGHNTRTCPRITERAQRNFDERLADRQARGDDPKEDPTLNYYAEQVGERTGVNPLTGAKHKKTGTEQRRCSYCKYVHGSWCEEGLGHTRRTCKELQADIAKDRVVNGRYRRKVLARMKAEGIGPGMLVRVRKSGWGEDAKYTTNLVHGINWGEISFWSKGSHNILRAKELSATGATKSIPLPKMEILRDGDTENSITFGAWWSLQKDTLLHVHGEHIQCLATAPTASMAPPADWFDGQCCHMETHFSKRKA
ncbi:MAG: hypothetical protein CMK72_07990 [Pseudomonadaceae bacterium]|nr:hypothetical protein [Pseudomonadaceae bacterium]